MWGMVKSCFVLVMVKQVQQTHAASHKQDASQHLQGMVLAVQLVCDSSLFFEAFLHDLDHFLCHSLASPGVLSTHYVPNLREWLS